MYSIERTTKFIIKYSIIFIVKFCSILYFIVLK